MSGPETTGLTLGEPRLQGVREHLRWLWGYWAGHKSILVFLAFFTLVSTAVSVAYPLVFRWVIDRLNETLGTEAATVSSEKIGMVMLVLAGIAVGRMIAGFYPATRALMNLRLDRDIREDVFAEILKKDYRFNNTFRTGDVVTRLTDDIYEFPKISWFGCSGIFRAVESSSKLIFCIAVMMTLNWQLTLLSLIPLPIMMWFFYLLRHRLKEYVHGAQRAISRTNDLLEAAFAGIRIVKAFRAEEGQKSRLAALMKERREVFLKQMKVITVLWSLDTLASRLGQMVVIGVGGYMVIRGTMSIGTLFAFYVFLDMLTHPMMDLPHLFSTGQQAFVSIDRVEEVRSFPVEVTRTAGGQLDGVDDVAFDRVSFTYGGDRPHLRDVSFRVPAGGRVAVVGPVASGKSTLLKLLAGVLQPEAGKILVNRRPLEEWNWDSYRLQLGYVPQEGVLFSKTIEENVLFGRSAPSSFDPDDTDRSSGFGTSGESGAAGASGHSGESGESGGAGESAVAERPASGAVDGGLSLDEAWSRRCLSVAQMERDLPDLPQGWKTVVGQKGSLVSGGQKQRIAIARALAGRPQLLLLDDCTAALDAHNEDQFWTRLYDELPGVTCFIVSHRLGTIRRADHILVMEDGELVDEGTHEQLAIRCATYREFLQTERRKASLEEEASGEAETAGVT